MPVPNVGEVTWCDADGSGYDGRGGGGFYIAGFADGIDGEGWHVYWTSWLSFFSVDILFTPRAMGWDGIAMGWRNFALFRFHLHNYLFPSPFGGKADVNEDSHLVQPNPTHILQSLSQPLSQLIFHSNPLNSQTSYQSILTPFPPPTPP